MIEADTRKAIFLLHQEGMGLREIERRLGVSRNTVRDIIEHKGEMPETVRRDKVHIDPEVLRRLYKECDSRSQRVHEKLVEEEGIEVRYSTLTRLLRKEGVSRPPKTRCDRVPDKPGAEIQHDTTVYQVLLAGTRVKLIASLMYLRYSKRRYLKFYRAFNRFTMKCFFHEALMFWGYTAPVCIIDNTNLARLRGTGRNAVIVPEMEAFSMRYGFEFRCHEAGHANRKAGEERSFFTVETNFLPGRRFQNMEDLNQQAYQWSTVRMENRPQGKARLIPAKTFEHEMDYLVRLPSHLPPPYLLLERSTDQYGYTAFDANYYWVPGTGRDDVKVLQYGDRLKIYLGRSFLVEYELPPDGVKNKLFSPEGMPPPRRQPKNRKKPTHEEEKRLRAMAGTVSDYLDFVLKTKGGIQRHRLMREMFSLSRQMTTSVFIRTIERGLRYRITSIDTLRRVALLCMNQETRMLPYAQVDENYREREAYREGNLSEAPNFSSYEKMTEGQDDE